jgi:hypothetical protein
VFAPSLPAPTTALSTRPPLARRAPKPGPSGFTLSAALKSLAWQATHALVRGAQAGATLFGRTHRVDLLIYKVDRLGDWLLAEPTLRRLVDATHQRGGSVVIWASRDTTPLRAWRPIPCAVETLAFEVRGWRARVRRTAAVLRLLATYRADTFLCLRHAPDPVRDFVLKAVSARQCHALTWRIVPGEPDIVPHEIRRHHFVLTGAGLAPADPRALLPHLPASAAHSPARIVIAPFSSAAIKDWPDAHWVAVAQALADRAPRWEIWVGRDQTARAEALAARLRPAAGDTRVTVHSGSLEALTVALASATAVLTVDTLAAHLATALDAPMVALLGGGQFGDFAPWRRSERQHWLFHRLPCFHCSWQCTQARNECLIQIAPAQVVAALHAVWPVSTPVGPADLQPAPDPRQLA